MNEHGAFPSGFSGVSISDKPAIASEVGPWKVRLSSTGEYYADRSIYCRFNKALAQEQCDELNRSEPVRAAAPDLLAACQAAIEATGGSAIWNGETKRFLEMCEAAIAKATGTSN